MIKKIKIPPKIKIKRERFLKRKGVIKLTSNMVYHTLERLVVHWVNFETQILGKTQLKKKKGLRQTGA